MTKLERLDAKIADARKKFDKAIAARDTAITALGKAAEKMKQTQRVLGRLERQKHELRKEERANKKRAPEGDAIPAL